MWIICLEDVMIFLLMICLYLILCFKFNEFILKGCMGVFGIYMCIYDYVSLSVKMNLFELVINC